MATTKTTRKKTASRPQARKPAKKPSKILHVISEPTRSAAVVCRSCNVLPAGSVEVTSLLLVLVFSLTAVLMTSIYALNEQSQKIDQLEMQIQSE